MNGDGQITPDEDRKVIGQVAPKWTGGITSNMDYKNFDFSFLINFSQGNTYRSNFHSNYSGDGKTNHRGHLMVMM
ncbi:hypothetical protein Q2T40_03725 [Winogradskyella maritima]|nr:hypothetical protein [Winogradskyella maritima]